jgi:hypothetical protein
VVEIPAAPLLATQDLATRLVHEAFVAQRWQAIVVVVPVQATADTATLAAHHIVVDWVESVDARTVVSRSKRERLPIAGVAQWEHTTIDAEASKHWVRHRQTKR